MHHIYIYIYRSKHYETIFHALPMYIKSFPTIPRAQWRGTMMVWLMVCSRDFIQHNKKNPKEKKKEEKKLDSYQLMNSNTHCSNTYDHFHCMVYSNFLCMFRACMSRPTWILCVCMCVYVMKKREQFLLYLSLSHSLSLSYLGLKSIMVDGLGSGWWKEQFSFPFGS